MSDYSQSSTAPRTPSARLMAPASLSVTVLIITMDTSVFERSVWQSMESESIPPPREYVSIWFVLCCYVYRGNSQPCRYLGLLELPRLCSLSCSGSHRDVRPKPCELQMSVLSVFIFTWAGTDFYETGEMLTVEPEENLCFFYFLTIVGQLCFIFSLTDLFYHWF